jgi:transcriptional regulator with XRE-family HTH domain
MSDHRQAIGRLIRTIRVSRGLSQRELAARMEVSQPYIARIETGVSSLSIEQLVQIGNILQCTIDIRMTPL